MLPLIALFLSISSAPNEARASAVAPVSSGPVASCAAVPRAAVESAVGRRLDPAEEETSRFVSTCTYSDGDAAVTISIRHLAEAIDLPAELQNLREAIPGSFIHELRGLSGRAFALEIPGAGTQLHVLPSAREYVLVSVLGVEDGHCGRAAAEKILRAVLRP